MRDSKGRFIKGHGWPEVWLQKNRDAHIGKPPPNKGKPMSEHQREIMRTINIGRKQSPETIAKRVLKLRGRKRSPEFRKMLSDLYKGEGNPSWRGGVSALRKRNSPEEQEGHKKWREAVFKRDNWTCVKCPKKGKGLQADHIKPWALFPELRYELSNGQTLCRKCHGLKTSWELKKYWKNQYDKSDYWKLLPP